MIAGKSAVGKSASLMGLKNPDGVMYLNCENNKKLPFKSKFKQYTVTDPLQVEEAFDVAEEKEEIHTIVIDSLTYLMDMFETIYVLPATNTQKAWGDYAQFLKRLMSQKVARSTKNVIFLAHTSDVYNESEMTVETLVKVKGSLMNVGIESFFSTVIACKKVSVKKLADFGSKMLNITPEEEALGFKYVYQTRLTKETVNERIRSSLGMWDPKETYIDNNAQLVLDKLHEYYS
jgi:hypothetical protein